MKLNELNLNNLTPIELGELIEQLQNLYNIKSTSTTHGIIEYKGGSVCSHCQGKHVVKNGHDQGVRRYICRECGKPFVASTKTLFHSTKLSYEQWVSFIQCEVLHMTLKESAHTIGVSQTTAFSMRHKLYDAVKLLKKTAS